MKSTGTGTTIEQLLNFARDELSADFGNHDVPSPTTRLFNTDKVFPRTIPETMQVVEPDVCQG